GDLRERAVFEAGRAVHQDVDAAKLVHALLDDVVDVGCFGDVRDDRQRFDAGACSDVLGALFQHIPRAGADGHAHAFAGQGQGDGFADALAAAADDGRLTAQSKVHSRATITQAASGAPRRSRTDCLSGLADFVVLRLVLDLGGVELVDVVDQGVGVVVGVDLAGQAQVPERQVPLLLGEGAPLVGGLVQLPAVDIRQELDHGQLHGV